MVFGACGPLLLFSGRTDLTLIMFFSCLDHPDTTWGGGVEGPKGPNMGWRRSAAGARDLGGRRGGARRRRARLGRVARVERADSAQDLGGRRGWSAPTARETLEGGEGESDAHAIRF